MSANLPKHIAIVMDGNGRWAKQRNLPRVAGHRAGVKTVHKLIKLCCEKKISILTLFAFGTENWQRPQQEVNHLLNLFMLVLRDELAKLHKQNIQLRFIGDRARFSSKLQAYITQAEQLTATNTGLKLVIAASYSGHWDIMQAVQQVTKAVQAGELDATKLTPTSFSQFLATGDLDPPDLLIRTSGELRLSNFLLWQLAYTELYFSEVYWPDFDKEHLEQALLDFARRQRRYGYTAEQIVVKGETECLNNA